MIGSVVVCHLVGGEVLVGTMELRGIYGPAYGVWIVGDHGERSLSWMDVESLLRVGSRVEADPRHVGTMAVIAASTKPPEQLCSDCPPVGYATDKTRCDPCPRRQERERDGLVIST